MRPSMQYDDDVVDTITLMEYEAGNLTEEDTIHMCATMLANNQVEQLHPRYTRLCNNYIKLGLLDEEGAINFIKVKEHL